MKTNTLIYSTWFPVILKCLSYRTNKLLNSILRNLLPEPLQCGHFDLIIIVIVVLMKHINLLVQKQKVVRKLYWETQRLIRFRLFPATWSDEILSLFGYVWRSIDMQQNDALHVPLTHFCTTTHCNFSINFSLLISPLVSTAFTSHL